MQKMRISKGNGKWRTVYCPSITEKSTLQHILRTRLSAHLENCTDAVQGFMPGKSPVTNAMQHIGYEYSMCFDLANFFDTVTESMFLGKFPEVYEPKLFVDGIAGQGLPTSPAVANLAAVDMDCDLEMPGVKYTRYADDLTFSFNDKELIEHLLTGVPWVVKRHGFAINEAKTKLQWAGAGRRIVTGVGVGHTSIYPTRKLKRKLRAAIHQGKRASARGLEEACKCRLPRVEQQKIDAARELLMGNQT